jgi:SAM-dependent methyltransferase
MYFRYQYESSRRMATRFMSGLRFHGTVLDIGCGLGGRIPYWLEQGADRVIGIDINEAELRCGATLLANEVPECAGRAVFTRPNDLPNEAIADVAVLCDTFEHLTNPAALLAQSARWLQPCGVMWIGSIGWGHYAASHCLRHIPIPWCQLLFSESAIIRTIQTLIRRPDYRPNLWEQQEGITRWDCVRTLKDRPGEPLNELSLRAVRRVLGAAPQFDVEAFTVHGLGRGLSGLACIPLLREVFHSYYTARLRRRPDVIAA